MAIDAKCQVREVNLALEDNVSIDQDNWRTRAIEVIHDHVVSPRVSVISADEKFIKIEEILRVVGPTISFPDPEAVRIFCRDLVAYYHRKYTETHGDNSPYIVTIVPEATSLPVARITFNLK